MDNALVAAFYKSDDVRLVIYNFVSILPLTITFIFQFCWHRLLLSVQVLGVRRSCILRFDTNRSWKVGWVPSTSKIGGEIAVESNSICACALSFLHYLKENIIFPFLLSLSLSFSLLNCPLAGFVQHSSRAQMRTTTTTIS